MDKRIKITIEAALEKKATNIVVIDLKGLSSLTDCFVIMSSNSDRHTQAIAEEILLKMEKAGHQALGEEGITEGRWAVLDFGDFMVHIFYEPLRQYYDLEGLWADAPRIEWKEKEGIEIPSDSKET